MAGNVLCAHCANQHCTGHICPDVSAASLGLLVKFSAGIHPLGGLLSRNVPNLWVPYR